MPIIRSLVYASYIHILCIMSTRARVCLPYYSSLDRVTYGDDNYVIYIWCFYVCDFILRTRAQVPLLTRNDVIITAGDYCCDE